MSLCLKEKAPDKTLSLVCRIAFFRTLPKIESIISQNMSTDQERKNRQRDTLRRLKALLKAQGYDADFLLESEELNQDAVSVTIGSDENEEDIRYAVISYFPHIQGTKDTELMQFFVALNGKLDSDKVPGLSYLFALINNKLPLGYFGINDRQTQVYLRYVWSHSAVTDPIDETHFSELFTILLYAQKLFSKPITDFLNGKADLKTAILGIEQVGSDL